MLLSLILMQRPLTREEGKLITRRRLIEATSKLLAEKGLAGVSGSAVARAAGIAQPTFYVHFKDKDELLSTVATERLGSLRNALRDARERLREGQGVEAIRETFRLPLETMIEQSDLFRLYLQQYHQPASPMGEQARKLFDELRADLTEDLVRLGIPSGTKSERQQLEMMSESMIVQTQALGIAILDGRYSNVEDAVEVLTRFAVGLLGV